MYLFLAAIKRKFPAQFLGVPSGAQHGGRLLIVCLEREGYTPQFLLEVPEVESPNPGGI
jgi:hypothetical protein